MSPSWEAASCTATLEFPNILWNPMVHNRIHKKTPLVPILRQINAVHTTPSYLRYILILSSHLRLGLPSGIFTSCFPTKILYPFLFSPMRELYSVFVVQACQTSQYVMPCGGIFLGKWRRSFVGSSNGKMNVQSACALNTQYYNNQMNCSINIREISSLPVERKQRSVW
jgi:hypothetical protein